MARKTKAARKTKSAKKTTAGNNSAADVRNLSLKLIDPPQHNPREDFDEAGLRSLAESIDAVGLLEPVIVRPKGKRFELVAGERRFRSVKFLCRKTITATVRKLNDCEASEVRLLENLDRESLNGIEESRALRQLQDLRHDLDSLAKLTRLTAAEINTRLVLVDLSQFWQDRIRSGQLSIAAAEYLLDWTAYPQVMEGLQKYVDSFPMPLIQWREHITQAVYALSRSMNEKHPDGPQFEIREGDDESLDIVTVRKSATIKARRAMNTDLWDARQDQANAIKPPRGQNGKPKQASETNRNGSRTTSPPLAALAEDDRGEHDFSERLTEWKAEWFRSLIRTRIDAIDIPELESAALHLGIDLDAEWTLTRDYLDLYSGRLLLDLAGEFRVDLDHAHTKAEAIAILLHARPPDVPGTFRDAGKEDALSSA